MMIELEYDDEKWQDLLNQMSLTEQQWMCSYGLHFFASAESVDAPGGNSVDGPGGVKKNNPTLNTQFGFPAPVVMAQTWNTTLIEKLGVAFAHEALHVDVTMLYAPGSNTHRSPYGGRNWEYFSEDGVLSGKLAANLVYGAKTNNLYCYIKHFAASEAGQNPNDKNTWLTEQALRECYLKPFEIAVKEGKGNAIMSCFNRIGAVWAGSNYALSTEVLRGEWGFRGSMITDWYQGGYMDYTRGILAGNDLWLKGNSSGPASLNFNDPGVAYAARQSAKNILYTFIDTYVTAKDYVPGEDDDFQTDVGGITATADPHSPLFSFLWTLINVVLALGIVACLFFAFGLDLIKSALKKRKQ